MLKGTNFTLTFKYNNLDYEISDMAFDDLLIHETIHLGIYFVELKLKSHCASLKDYPLITGMNFKININVENTNEILDLDTTIYDKNEQDDFIILLLMPTIYCEKLGRLKISKGYKDKIDNIINTIADEVGLTQKEIERTSLEKKIFLQLDQTHFQFIKENTKYAKNQKSNYLFFIDKFNKLKFYSMNYLKNKNVVAQIADDYIDNIIIKDLSFSVQLKSGFGGTAYYFNWDEGTFDNVVYDESKFTGIGNNDRLSDKIGINKNFISEQNNILMLNTVGQDIFPIVQYNEVELENEMLRKNYFNVFITFTTFGILKVTPAELIDLYFKSSLGNEANQIYSGKWFVYSVVHSFSMGGYNMNVTIANASINGLLDNNFI